MLIQKIKPKKSNSRLGPVNYNSIFSRPKRSQQEMVGFVLIVALVIIAMMVFLVFYLRKPISQGKSVEIDALISSLMRFTTECSEYGENFYNLEELIKVAYKGEECNNLDQEAKIHLNETLRKIIEDVMKTEASVAGYELSIKPETNTTEKEFLRIYNGVLSEISRSNNRIIYVDDEKLRLSLVVYYSNSTD